MNTMVRLNFKRFVALSVLSSILIGSHVLCQTAKPDTTGTQQGIRFADQIASFFKEDKTNPPPKNAILFIGSSIFRQWTHLKEQMAPLPVFNRAFGGSRTDEVLHQVKTLVIPHEPRIIVYYCGSNDVNAGVRATEVFLNFKRFCDRVSEALPHARIFFVSINRAPQKMNRWSVVDSANTLVRDYCASNRDRHFIDVNPVLFDKVGKPRLELYRDDQLHFKDPAYEEFTRVIKPVIERSWMELERGR
jgi:lysophospholipase L1-like esterase